MNIPKHAPAKKSIVLVASLLVIAVGIFLYTNVFKQTLFGWPNHENSTIQTDDIKDFNTNPPSESEIETGTDTKEQTVENDKGADTKDDVASDLHVTLTANGENQGVYQLRYLIEGVVNSGTCSLKLSKNGTTIHKSASIQALANTSTCQGFDIPVSELSSGQWTATMTATNGDMNGTAVNTIEVE